MGHRGAGCCGCSVFTVIAVIAAFVLGGYYWQPIKERVSRLCGSRQKSSLKDNSPLGGPGPKHMDAVGSESELAPPPPAKQHEHKSRKNNNKQDKDLNLLE